MDVDALNDEVLRHHDLLGELGPDDGWYGRLDGEEDDLDVADLSSAEAAA